MECQTETRLANRQQCDPYEEEACQEIPDEQCSEVDEEKCEIISKSVEEEVCSDVPGESCSEVTDEECEIIEEVEKVFFYHFIYTHMYTNNNYVYIFSGSLCWTRSDL